MTQHNLSTHPRLWRDLGALRIAGIHMAFFDATMGLGVPVLGMAVAALGFGAAFALGASGAPLSLGVAANPVVRTRRARQPRQAAEGAR